MLVDDNLINKVLKDEDLKNNELNVYLVFCLNCDKDTNEVSISASRISEELQITEKSTRSCIKSLIKKGYLDVLEQSKGYYPSRYKVLEREE